MHIIRKKQNMLDRENKILSDCVRILHIWLTKLMKINITNPLFSLPKLLSLKDCFWKLRASVINFLKIQKIKQMLNSKSYLRCEALCNISLASHIYPFTAVVLKVWSWDQRHQHQLGTFQKASIQALPQSHWRRHSDQWAQSSLFPDHL